MDSARASTRTEYHDLDMIDIMCEYGELRDGLAVLVMKDKRQQ